MAAPAPFNVITSYETASVSVNALRTVSVNITSCPTFLNAFPDNYNNYIQKINAMRAASPKEKNAVVADMVTETLRDACPAVAQFYCLGQGFVTRSRAFFSTDPSVQVLNYDAYIATGTQVTDPKEIDDYNHCVDSYRTYMVNGGFALNNELATLRGAVKNTINASGNLVPLQVMLREMIEKRRFNLGGTSAGAEHLREVREALSGDLDQKIIFPFSKSERKAVGFSFSNQINNRAERNEGGRCLLASTAVAKDTQLEGDLLNTITRKFHAMPQDHVNYQLFDRIIREANAILDPEDVDAADGAGFLSQRSNIDPLWLTFYFAFKVIKLSVADFYKWQRAIYATCRKIRGKENIRAVLATMLDLPGVQDTLGKMSQSTEIHTPPWVMHFSRLYDIAAVICPCDAYNVAATIQTPAISWRYLFTVNPAVKGFISYLTTLNAVEKTADETSEIHQSERMLQQFILGRNSPLANTNHLTGNALDVTIVG
ncbi:nucleocapsid protein [Sanxia Water Strider Virus 1]|uniref:Nucleocapsid protein n=1 Tax=Sanxia Water Strider Virus 1 TaxID=1608060 RepID=A0A0B5KFK1_9VIRU|nr:nucleocapsid protein [Sanxia Water Strider Virus 1]AJG39309.1 nucleocapsid protein [Sanxia Water Strider Virus 1]APG79323.1 putative nucleoprotein [Sanxia Water Strider Virus 1]